MDRTHIYKIPEQEIETKPSRYLRYLRKYGQVHFELSESSYASLKESWNQIKDMKNNNINITENDISNILSTYKLHDDRVAFGILAFLVAAIPYLRKLTTEHLDNDRVMLIVE